MFATKLLPIKKLLFRPFFSVVIPTRDRPEFVEISISILLAQSFEDFEIIVSDNGLNKLCGDIIAKFDDPRIKYIRPKEPLEMAQHWEFACKHARGKYVSVLIDKTFLHTDALKLLHQELSDNKYDLVSWSNEVYVPIDESKGYTKGYYNPQYQATGPRSYSPQAELEKRLSCELDLWAEGESYFRGKICFGAFSSKLISRIIRAQGCLFHSVCPDYTATASALALASNALDMGQPLMASFLTSISNGMNYYKSPEYALNFLIQVDQSGSVLDELPVKNLYASTHNLIAGDYVRVKNKLKDKRFPFSLNIDNLIDRIISDLAVVGFESQTELEEQIQCLIDFRPSLDKNEVIARVLSEKEKRSLTGNQSASQIKEIYEGVYKKFDNPLEMANEMARYYAEVLKPEPTYTLMSDL